MKLVLGSSNDSLKRKCEKQNEKAKYTKQGEGPVPLHAQTFLPPPSFPSGAREQGSPAACVYHLRRANNGRFPLKLFHDVG